MEITFYKLTCPLNQVGKTMDDTTKIVESNIHLLFDKSVINPSFLLSTNLAGYNYAVTDASLGNRKYFLSPGAKEGQLYRYTLQLDALETYKAEALGKTVILERQESKANPYLLDETWKVSTNHQVVTKLFPNSIGETTSTILTVLGGV